MFRTFKQLVSDMYEIFLLSTYENKDTVLMHASFYDCKMKIKLLMC